MQSNDTDIPEHITPQAIYQMTVEQQEKLLEGLRDRRLSALRQYEEAKRLAAEAEEEKARVTLFKQCEMCEKNITRVIKALDALDERINKMRALRLQLGLD